MKYLISLITLLITSTTFAQTYDIPSTSYDGTAVHKNGAQVMAGSLTITGGLLLGGATLTLKGQVANGATAVGVILDNGVTLSTAGAKILSVRNNNVEKFYVDKDGNTVALGTLNTSGGGNINTAGSVVASGITANVYTRSTNTVVIRGSIADGATAVAVKLSSVAALNTAGANIAVLYKDAEITPKTAIDLRGAIRLGIGTTAATPVCDANNRGTLDFIQGTTGGVPTKDELSVCAKDAADAYAWRPLY